MLPFVYNDGGRAAAGYKGTSRDCVCRAIAIASRRPYQEIYDLINAAAQGERTGKRKRGVSSARTGVYKTVQHKVLASLGFTWVPTMAIGQGCKVHLREEEIPLIGRLMVSLSKHATAVINGQIHDIEDPSRGGMRCVYGYWIAPEMIQ